MPSKVIRVPGPLVAAVETLIRDWRASQPLEAFDAGDLRQPTDADWERWRVTDADRERWRWNPD